jgi:hypothetical protein
MFAPIDLSSDSSRASRHRPYRTVPAEDDDLVLLLAFVRLLPFNDRGGGDDATSFLKRILPELRSLNAFRTGVEEETVGQFESPTHEFDMPLAVLVDGDHGLYRPRRNIILGIEIEFFETGSHI